MKVDKRGSRSSFFFFLLHIACVFQKLSHPHIGRLEFNKYISFRYLFSISPSTARRRGKKEKKEEVQVCNDPTRLQPQPQASVPGIISCMYAHPQRSSTGLRCNSRLLQRPIDPRAPWPNRGGSDGDPATSISTGVIPSWCYEYPPSSKLECHPGVLTTQRSSLFFRPSLPPPLAQLFVIDNTLLPGPPNNCIPPRYTQAHRLPIPPPRSTAPLTRHLPPPSLPRKLAPPQIRLWLCLVKAGTVPRPGECLGASNI